MLKRVNKITVFREADPNGGIPDYLGKFGIEPGGFAVPHMHGEIEESYVQAKAEIATSLDGKTWVLNTVSSPGLFGIDSDSEPDYFTEVAHEQLDELRDVLHALGVQLKYMRYSKQRLYTLIDTKAKD